MKTKFLIFLFSLTAVLSCTDDNQEDTNKINAENNLFELDLYVDHLTNKEIDLTDTLNSIEAELENNPGDDVLLNMQYETQNELDEIITEKNFQSELLASINSTGVPKITPKPPRPPRPCGGSTGCLPISIKYFSTLIRNEQQKLKDGSNLMQVRVLEVGTNEQITSFEFNTNTPNEQYPQIAATNFSIENFSGDLLYFVITRTNSKNEVITYNSGSLSTY